MNCTKLPNKKKNKSSYFRDVFYVYSSVYEDLTQIFDISPKAVEGLGTI